MFDSHVLFKQRFLNHMQELKRYLQYIFNGHMAIAMVFFLSVMAIYYQKWLEQLPDYFPGALVISIVFGVVVSKSPVRTLLKEPDLVFLMMAEHKMKSYFRDAVLYSFVVQLYLIVLVFSVMAPLCFTFYPARSGRAYLLIDVFVIIFYGWYLLGFRLVCICWYLTQCN